VFQVLVLPVSVILVQENVLVIVSIYMVRYLSFLDGHLVNKFFLFFALFHKSRLENSASVHDIFFNFAQNSIDSFSVILFSIFLIDFCNLLVFMILLKSHIKLVGMEGFHSLVVLTIGMFFGFDVFDKVFVAEL
jgi:hypothetical protein